MTIIQKDFYRATGKWLSNPEIWLKCMSPNLHYIYILRKCQRFNKKTPLGAFWRLMLYRHQIKYGFQIYPETEIGEGFYLGHWGTVIINPKTVIGANCNIAAGVTIGQANRGKSQGVPKIGDKVWIGPNAVVVGNISIGDNVLIAPNAYVNTDVPKNSIAMGNPARIFPNEQATEGYINNVID